MDANEIISEEKIFKYRDHDSYAGFANLFRCKLLLEKGGYWSDLDIICLKNLEEDGSLFLQALSMDIKLPIAETFSLLREYQ